jgi:ribosome-binding protein aMBF1 (putative translation factor)
VRLRHATSFGNGRLGCARLPHFAVDTGPMSDDVRHLVGQNVRRLRLAAGLSQAALAARMDVDRAYISALELGRRNPTIVTLWHISKALDVRPFQFFQELKTRRARR